MRHFVYAGVRLLIGRLMVVCWLCFFFFLYNSVRIIIVVVLFCVLCVLRKKRLWFFVVWNVGHDFFVCVCFLGAGSRNDQHMISTRTFKSCSISWNFEIFRKKYLKISLNILEHIEAKYWEYIVSVFSFLFFVSVPISRHLFKQDSPMAAINTTYLILVNYQNFVYVPKNMRA